MISYEIILSSAIWFIVPLLPVFIFYFIAVLAETSRTPFDLQEAKPVL